MDARKISSDRLVVDLSSEEAVIIYLCIVEAMEALSETEFRARVGRPESEAKALAAQLKPLIIT